MIDDPENKGETPALFRTNARCRTSASWPEANVAVSLCLDVRLVDGVAVFVVFRAEITTEARGTFLYWTEHLGDKLLLERPQGGREPPGEL